MSKVVEETDNYIFLDFGNEHILEIKRNREYRNYKIMMAICTIGPFISYLAYILFNNSEDELLNGLSILGQVFAGFGLVASPFLLLCFSIIGLRMYRGKTYVRIANNQVIAVHKGAFGVKKDVVPLASVQGVGLDCNSGTQDGMNYALYQVVIRTRQRNLRIYLPNLNEKVAKDIAGGLSRMFKRKRPIPVASLSRSVKRSHSRSNSYKKSVVPYKSPTKWNYSNYSASSDTQKPDDLQARREMEKKLKDLEDLMGK